MTESQRDRITPYWDVIKLGHEKGSWIGGESALHTMNQVNIELGNPPTKFNCAACVFSLLKLIYNNYVKD